LPRHGRRRHRRRHHLRQLPQRRAAQSVGPQGQFGNLIFGFAVTEALGIFSLLIALLLLFAV
jgi:hypothetical protein